MNIRCGLAIGPAKSCVQTERAAECADVRGQQRHDGGGPTERRSAGKITDRIAGTDQDHDISQAIGQLVVEVAGRRLETLFDRQQPVQQIAEQPELNRRGRDNAAPPAA